MNACIDVLVLPKKFYRRNLQVLTKAEMRENSLITPSFPHQLTENSHVEKHVAPMRTVRVYLCMLAIFLFFVKHS